MTIWRIEWNNNRRMINDTRVDDPGTPIIYVWRSEQKNNNNNITNNMKSGAKRLSRSMAENIYSHIGQRW